MNAMKRVTCNKKLLLLLYRHGLQKSIAILYRCLCFKIANYYFKLEGM